MRGARPAAGLLLAAALAGCASAPPPACMPASVRGEPEDNAGTFGNPGTIPRAVPPADGCAAAEPALEADGPAIDTPPPGVVVTESGTLGSGVRLGWRQPLALPDGLVLELIGLEEDSRCPAGVQCVWAGRATVAIAVFKGAAEPRRLKLSLPGPAATYQDYGLTLVALEPAPVSGRRTPEAELVATVAIGPAQNLR